MKAIRSALLGLSLVLVFGVADATAVAQKGKKKAAAAGELVPSALLDQLNLTAEQKKQAAQLQDEFAARAKQARVAAMPEMKKAKADKDKAAAKKAAASLKLAIGEVRQDLEPRFVRILTDAQKKKYEELKKGVPAVGKFAPTPPETVKGTIKLLDTDKGTLLLTVDGQAKTYLVSRATKVLDAAGSELPNGLTDKALAPGVAVSILTTKPSPRAVRLNVLELKLAGK